MTEQKQQYAVLNCKKISKAKTTSLKLYNQDQSSQDSIEKNDKFYHHVQTKQQVPKSVPKSQNFSYLDQSRDGLGKGKSFQDIMDQSRKFLEMKKNMEDEQKKREQSKKVLKAKKKSDKKQKQAKKQKRKQTIEKLKGQQQDIMLTELDLQKFSTQSPSIKSLIAKIDWLKNLGQKCNIISPFLYKIQQESSLKNNCQIYGNDLGQKGLFIDKNENMLIKVSELELEIELMKRNLSQIKEEKDFLSSFEISQLAKWQIEQRSTQGAQKLINSYPFLQKYIDRENLQLYAENLQNQLEHMEMTEFQKFEYEEQNYQA